jgi:hypothetical protein
MSNTAHDAIAERPLEDDEQLHRADWGSPAELSEFAEATTQEEPLDEPGPCDLAR